MFSIVLLLSSLLSCTTSKKYPILAPITDRDEYNKNAKSIIDHPLINDPDPEVFKCRTISTGSTFVGLNPFLDPNNNCY